jgi:signal transduction histidine kinase
MLDRSSFQHFLSKGDASKRLDFFKCHKDQILAYLLEFLQSGPPTVYREFILNDTEGQERVRVYLNSFEAALAGNVDAFLDDQKRIGYIRAMEGYHLNDVYGFTVAFKDALWLTGKGYNNAKQNSVDRLSNDDIYALNKLLDGSFYFLSLSFLETRDEIITRHREQLQTLQRYAAGVVSVFEEEDIWARTTQGVFDVFGLNGTFFLTCGEQFEGKGFQVGRMIGLQVTHREMEKLLESINQSLAPMGLDNHDTLHPLSNSMDTDQFRFVASPVMDSKYRLIGVLCVHDQGRTFRFSKFDRNLFCQLTYFTGAVSTNCRILSEIAEKKEDLRNLTARLISVQEEERKKIAADIHDVLTQALTGIGYKALYCMEIAGQDIDRLHKELEMLTETINDALRQSRQIIGNLRPHVLDDIGIIAAFRKLIGDFGKKFAIDVHFSHPDDLQINPDKGIALFRILQEALHNARRHAKPTTVNLSLSFENKIFLLMRVQDNGKGFDPQKRNRQRKRPGLGLLTMRERAEDMGGEFQIVSHLGEGCMIIVKIPLKEGQND